MGLLILGVLLWCGAHFWKRITPSMRAGFGDKGKGIVALLLLASVLAMVIGYRMSDVIPVYEPPAFMRHINNLLVLIAIFMMSPAPAKGVLLHKMRHPQLTGFGLWAFAHLLVNGDLASLVLFGGLLIWAMAEIVVINRAEPDWAGRARGAWGKDAMFFAASVVLYAVIGGIHMWIGPSPFPM